MKHFINWIIALIIIDCALVSVRICICYWEDWSAAIKNQIKKWRKKRIGHPPQIVLDPEGGKDDDKA